MLEFFAGSGWPMWFTFSFGVIGLILAGLTAYRPSAARLAVCEGAKQTVLYTTIGGFAGACSMTLRASHLALGMKDRPDLWPSIAFEGFSECMSIPIMGFALLSLIAMLTTVARMRSV